MGMRFYHVEYEMENMNLFVYWLYIGMRLVCMIVLCLVG